MQKRTPTTLVRSGYVRLDISAGTARIVGSNGYGWTQTALSFSDVTSATVYNLSFNTADVYPSGGPDRRWYGFPLRCLSTALEG